MNDIEQKDVLDLFAGSGSLGLEAVSRGARSVVFVEAGYHQAEAIKSNLKSLGLKARLVKSDYKAAARRLHEENLQFDIIFADPPYEKYSPGEIADMIIHYNLLRDDGFFIIEHKTGLKMDNERMFLLKRRKFGQTEVSFYAGQNEKK
jgi:16S rRNA (guanine(966)-N(2))-methyltransferase RsmD